MSNITPLRPYVTPNWPRRIKFLVWTHTGPVTLKLVEGGSLEHVSGGPTDEGYSYSRRVWLRTRNSILMEVTTDARDCDGRATTCDQYACPLDRLGARYDEDGHRYPDWVNINGSQRDYSAEAMGY